MTFTSEREVKATRKAHKCDACHAHIPTFGPMFRWSGIVDGEFVSLKYHLDCRDAERALNDIYDTHGPDEWMTLGDYESEDAGWLWEDYPAVASRLGVPKAISL